MPAPNKARKVAILSGAYTALCPLALICGVETVGEAVTGETGVHFLDRLLDEQVIPFLSLPKDELESFAAFVRPTESPLTLEHPGAVMDAL